MTSKADWKNIPGKIDADPSRRFFFTEHEWRTVDAACGRIIPSEEGSPGAREAGVVVFIDRYLSGPRYYYATADGSGFLQMAGVDAYGARLRLRELRDLYRTGVRELDRVANELHKRDFWESSDEEQDRALEKISGSPKPAPLSLTSIDVHYSRLQANTDEDRSFFDTLCLHTRQGFYCDPVYGGNQGRVGWAHVGFPGPDSLADTMDGTYSTADLFVQEYSWEDLVPGFTEDAPTSS